MTPAEIELWQRIKAFAFDEPLAAWPFSARLAKENRWSPEFTARAIEEYRRFAFLAVVSAGPVSPSDIVDHVWHEHLLYTRNYWDEFCRRTINRPLHHEPTRGGAAERAKFDDWYARTVESYRRHFGAPPADIWPAPKARTAALPHGVSIGLSRHWIVSKFRGATAKWSLIACIPFAFLGCASIGGGAYNPLDWNGPKFLRFWWPLAIGMFVFAGVVRWWLRTNSGAMVATPVSDPVEIALLAGGPTRVVQSTIASLVRRDVLRLADGSLDVSGPLPANAAPVERRIHEACEATRFNDLADLQRAIAPEVALHESALKQAGLMVDDATVGRIRRVVLSCAAIPLLLGLAKFVVGVNRGRPVGFLFVGMFIAAVVTVIMLMRPRNTRAGDQVIDRLRRENDDLTAEALDHRGAHDGTSASLAVALFGVTVLPALGMEDFRSVLTPRGGSSGCGSGCGGGGCGGGGGGCGGCSGG